MYFIKATEEREQRGPKRKSWVLKYPVRCRRTDKAPQVTNRTQREGPCAQVNSGQMMGLKIEKAPSSSPTLDTNLLCGKGQAT